VAYLSFFWRDECGSRDMKKAASIVIAGLLAACLLWCRPAAGESELIIDARRRAAVEGCSDEFAVVSNRLRWRASETALIICDMWDRHWCKGATRRVAELAVRLNEFSCAAREKGVLIVHAPSDTMGYYEDHAGRNLARAASEATSLPDGIEKWCRWISDREKAAYPIDQSDGGCDCDPQCQSGKAWTRQIETIAIHEADIISDRGAEIWNVFEQRGIKNVLVAGVHTNMCVLGRPFGLRNMARFGKNVVLVRDLTDTMYNHRMRPYVSHFTGTDLIVEHIEKYVCPTITSSFLTGKAPFRFCEDKRDLVVFLSAESEYDASRTLASFAHELALKYGPACEILQGSTKAEDPERNYLGGLSALVDAEAAVVFVRRRALPGEQMKLLRGFVASGRGVVGIRTASHAFALRGEVPAGLAVWPEFDGEVLGGNYHGHHGNKGEDEPRSYVWVESGVESHEIVSGVPGGPIEVRSWLYKTSPLSEGATVLMMGRVGDRKPHEPVTWTYRRAGGGRAFYTSLGHPEDFKMPWFSQMLVKGVFWAMGKELPSSTEAPKSN